MMLLQATYLLGEPERNLFKPLLLSFLLSVISLGILSLMAWLTASTAMYTLTNKRVVMRIGIVLTLTYNLPLRLLAGASAERGGRWRTPESVRLPAAGEWAVGA